MKQEKINTIREIILNEDIGKLSRKSSLFGGADISIVPKLPDTKDDFYGSPQYVATNYSKELSWLIFKLKEIFNEDLDYMNKYSFYGRLAERANKSIEAKGDNLITILLDVLDEAEIMHNEGDNF
jgi:hypothetical protein